MIGMNIVLIEGDGIGREVVPAARRCLESLLPEATFEEALMGQDAIDEYDTPLPEETVEKVRDAGLALKGPVTTPIGSGFRSVNVELRKRLELYANVRPCRYSAGVRSRLTRPEDVDIVVFRENLEDLYSGIEFEEGTDEAAAFRKFLAENSFDTPQDSGYSVKPISRKGSRRLIRRAFEYAEENDRDRVTIVDKANIMKYTDGMFMEMGEEVAEEFDIEHEHLLVDNVAQKLVMEPERFDVIATQNIYGDILSDLCGGLVGGIGMVPSANLGDETAVFATVHGSAPDIAGENRANPAAIILSAAMLLDYAGKEDEADRLRQAVEDVVRKGENVTADLGGDASTDEMADVILGGL